MRSGVAALLGLTLGSGLFSGPAGVALLAGAGGLSLLAAPQAEAATLHVSLGVNVRVKRGHGRLDIEVAPERAKVYLDGRYLGRGDARRVVRAGKHRVKVVLGDGREVEAETVHVEAGRVTHVRLDLR
jgi:hypothetical protein